VIVKTCIMLKQIFILNKRCSVELNIHQRKEIYYCSHKNMKQHSNVFNINEKYLLSSRVISEGSCDTEDWSNDAEYSDLLSKK